MRCQNDGTSTSDKENDIPNQQSSADQGEEPPKKRLHRSTPLQLRMTSDEYYTKMTRIEEAKLEETKRHNLVMEELARQNLEETKRRHLELEL